MRFSIMHATNAHWESGATPDPALIARVGRLLGDLKASGALLAAEGCAQVRTASASSLPPGRAR
jgi:hypothetical protein